MSLEELSVTCHHTVLLRWEKLKLLNSSANFQVEFVFSSMHMLCVTESVREAQLHLDCKWHECGHP